MSDIYINNEEPLERECFYKHLWTAVFVRAENSWCHQCSPTTAYGEKYTKAIMEIMFNEKFVHCRPEWLINPKTGYRLELDMYSEKLALACEYQGSQHAKYSKKFHGSVEKFHEQQVRDKEKLNICDKREIKLLYVPYTVKSSKIHEYIINLCEQNNINIPNKNEIDINKLKIFTNDSNNQLDKLKKIAKDNGGECLNESFIRDGSMNLNANVVINGKHLQEISSIKILGVMYVKLN